MIGRRAAARALAAWLCGDETDLESLIGEAQFDWVDLVQLASQERVLPALHGLHRDMPALRDLPLDLTEFLKSTANSNLERNERIFQDLSQTVSLLNSFGIEPILLKGVAYLQLGVYADRAARYLMDIDLLIPESDLEAAVTLLFRNGYFEDSTDRLGRFRHHHPPLRGSGGTWVELHHSLGPAECRAILPADDVIGRSLRVEWDGCVARVPCPNDLVAHHVIHTQMVHSYWERIWPPLLGLFDLELLGRRFKDQIEWPSIRKKFQKTNATAILDLYLLQAGETLRMNALPTNHLNVLTRLKWVRRRVLKNAPALRFIDPIYLFSAVIKARLRIFAAAWEHPAGKAKILGTLLSRGFLQRVWVDLFAK